MFRRGVFEVLIFFESERSGIEAEAQTGGGRAVFKNMAQVCAATDAFDFRPSHAVAVIGFGEDVLLGDGLKETGPAGAGIKLCLGCEQRQVATNAVINTRFVLVVKRAAECGFRALIARDMKHFGLQEFGPFRVGLDHFRR